MTTENGAAPEDPILTDLHQRITLLREQESALAAQMEGVTSMIKRYERAIKVLQDEPLRVNKPTLVKRVRKDHTRIGQEKLDLVRRAIMEFAETHDEFRQVDIRGLVAVNSSASAVAFEQLRQQNVIRFARKDGNNKYYRLTREALNAAT